MAYYSYVRCSTDTQMDNNGFEMQYDVINKYAAESGITIDESFEDAGISGTKLDRAGVIDLLATVKEGDYVIVQNTSRLWRNGFVKEMLKHQMKECGVEVISIEQPTYSVNDESDPEEFLMNSILELFDQYEKIKIALKLAKGRKAKARNGYKSCGKAPYGYSWNDDAEIIVSDSESNVVKMIFNAYEEIGSLQGVADFINQSGARTTKGNEFSKKTISDILHNQFYCGMVKHGEIIVNGCHAAIISDEQFNRVNHII